MIILILIPIFIALVSRSFAADVDFHQCSSTNRMRRSLVGEFTQQPVRIFDIETDKVSYSLGDTFDVTVHGRVMQGMLEHPIMLVEIKQSGMLFMSYRYDLCNIAATSMCPAAEGSDFSFTISETIPSYNLLKRYTGNPFRINSVVEDHGERVSCTYFDLDIGN